MRRIRRFARSETGEAARRVTEALSREPGVRLVFLFGSAVGDGPEQARDLDLAVLIDPAPSVEQWRRLQLVAARAASLPVDLVPLHRAPVVLRREIVDSGICLFSSSPETEADFVTRARSRYWDFRPFLDRQWDLSRRRAEERLADGAST